MTSTNSYLHIERHSAVDDEHSVARDHPAADSPPRRGTSPLRGERATAHSLGHTAGEIETAMLGGPNAATKTALHELIAENASLRARNKQLTQELREEREIAGRRMRMAQRATLKDLQRANVAAPAQHGGV